MVPFRIFHIYGVWTSRSKKVWGMLKSHQLGVAMQVIGKAGSHFVILLYCETLLQVSLDICCKKCYQLPLHQKCNSKCCNNINTEWAIPEKVLGFLLYPWKFQTKQGFTPRFFM